MRRLFVMSRYKKKKKKNVMLRSLFSGKKSTVTRTEEKKGAHCCGQGKHKRIRRRGRG